MKYLVLCCILNCLFFVNTVYSLVTIQPVYLNPLEKAVNYTVKKTFHLTCNVTNDDPTSSPTVQWFKGNTSVTDVNGLKSRVTIDHKNVSYTMKVRDAEYGDAGTYSCKASVASEVAEATFIVSSNIAVQIKPDDINVVEEEKLRIVCQVLGNPVPELTWEIVTEAYNETLTSNSSDGRILILEHRDENDKIVPNGLLVIEKAKKEDRGDYFCIGRAKYHGEEEKFKSYVRVKDKYAALWPFLGICIEVVVLCAIIIIYEKKRNKTELEESDTDQSPDQKNTPDHGKEANLRHRQ